MSIEKLERLLAEGLNITDSVNLIKSEIEKNPIKNRKKLFTNHILGYNYSGSRRLERNLLIMDVGEIVNIYFSSLQTPARNFEGHLENFFGANYFKEVSRAQKFSNTIFLSIYADEININNPIGDPISFKFISY